jgi:hypothetical protein
VFERNVGSKYSVTACGVPLLSMSSSIDCQNLVCAGVALIFCRSLARLHTHSGKHVDEKNSRERKVSGFSHSHLLFVVDFDAPIVRAVKGLKNGFPNYGGFVFFDWRGFGIDCPDLT